MTRPIGPCAPIPQTDRINEMLTGSNTGIFMHGYTRHFCFQMQDFEIEFQHFFPVALPQTVPKAAKHHASCTHFGRGSGVARNLRQGVCKVVLSLPSPPFPSHPLPLPSLFPSIPLPFPSSLPLPLLPLRSRPLKYS